MPDIDVRPVDLADDAQFDEFYRVRTTALTCGRPHFVPATRAESAAAWQARDDGWSKEAVGVHVDGELVSVAHAQCSTEDNIDTAWVFVETVPEHRREGHGRRALAALMATLDPSRTKVLSSVLVPAAEMTTHPYRLFADAAGARVETTSALYELTVPASAPEAAVPDGYDVRVFVDGAPDELLEGLGRLMGLVDVEAPSGDIEWEASPVSPEQYRAEVARYVAAGGHVLDVVAVERPAGPVAAFTRLLVSADPARPAHQEGTLVDVAHRGHGLGLAVKAANLGALASHFPHSARVHTQTDDANRWMRAVNDRLGFVPVEAELVVRLPRAASS